MEYKRRWFKPLLFCGVATLLWGGVMQAAAQDGGRTDSEDDLVDLSDEFEDADTLTDWLQFHEVEGWPNMYQEIDINTTSAGHLYLDLATSGWYADYHGTYMFKEVTGDFVAITRLWAQGHASDIADQLWSLAGIMARTPRDITSETWTPLAENWVFVTTGVARVADDPVFETKTTVDSNSELELHPGRAGWVELALVRIGADFGMFYRYDGETDWVMLRRYSRPDMPDTLQVGLNAYTDWPSVETMSAEDFNAHPPADGNPDLVVLVDYFRFNRPTLPDDFDNTIITPATWLSFLPTDQ